MVRKRKKRTKKQLAEAAAAMRKKRAADPDANIKTRAWRYNISIEDVKELLLQNKCEICDKELTDKEKCIDHCHDTGLVRGVLCQACNKGIGIFDDSTELLDKASNYLKNAK